jgi:hypothetical protein
VLQFLGYNTRYIPYNTDAEMLRMILSKVCGVDLHSPDAD